MAPRLGISLVLVSVTFGLLAAVGSAGAEGVSLHPDVPSGACDGRWRPPSVAVPFDRENLVRRRRYPGFRIRRLFEVARSHVDTSADGYVRNRRRLYTATFIFTGEVDARLEELRGMTRYPANIRGLRACYTIADLTRLQRLVNDGLLGGGKTDPDIRGRVEFTLINVFDNRVKVGLRRFRERDKDRIEARYGPAVRVLRGDHSIGFD